MSPLLEIRHLDEVADATVVCATRRLVARLSERYDREQQDRGRVVWPPLDVLTLDAWLDRMVDRALLAGRTDVAHAPHMLLSSFAERLLWERLLAADEQIADALLDLGYLAAAAAEANALMTVWNLSGDGPGGEETQRFLRWRQRMHAVCRRNGWLDAAQGRAWQLRVVAASGELLPRRICFAGFDRYTPQDRDLQELLAAGGVEVAELLLGRDEPGEIRLAALPDRYAECRAVAAWAAERLSADPALRLGVVAPQLAEVREPLCAALDDALHPAALIPGGSDLPRCYNLSLGPALAEQAVIVAALRLLRMAAMPTAVRRGDLAELLCGQSAVFWSLGEAEAEARAHFDVSLRERQMAEFDLKYVLRLARRRRAGTDGMAGCIGHLQALLDFAEHRQERLPGQWPGSVIALLEAAGWPGQRPLSSHEWQARTAFLEMLGELAELDAVLGRIDFPAVVRILGRLARERIFQPETEGRPALEVLGPLEAAGAEFDELWILGLNEEQWPPPPRPNPLLPAWRQRLARTPNASAAVQAEFAEAIQQRLIRSAPIVILSYARTEGDRSLRPGPWLRTVARREYPPPVCPSRIETTIGRGEVVAIVDRRGPPVPRGTVLSGGIGLLRAQALCPAWAFYRYRLGARALPEPGLGLTAGERGTLLHRALEFLWRGRTSPDLLDLGIDARRAAAGVAAAAALSRCQQEREPPLPPRYAVLEQQRLTRLLVQWLEAEQQREQAFTVVACEAPVRADIDGVSIDLTLDRLDRLADGRYLLLDYKSGKSQSIADWEGPRIAEPQLPAYAVWAGQTGELAGVCFARVRPGECGFVGIGERALAPGIQIVAPWSGILASWGDALSAIAHEIRDGEAGVEFTTESDLLYCEVTPLLRLPERRERGGG